MDNAPLKTGDKLLLQHGPAVVRCIIKHIEYKIDINPFLIRMQVVAYNSTMWPGCGFARPNP